MFMFFVLSKILRGMGRGRAFLQLVIPTLFLFSCWKDSYFDFSQAEPACNFVLDGKKRVSWKKEAPIEIYVDKSVPESFNEALEKAVAKWNELEPGLFELVAFHVDMRGGRGEEPKTPFRRDGHSVISYFETWPFEPTELVEQARTQTYHTTGSIFEADMAINGEENLFYLGEKRPQKDAVDLQSVLVHELGHMVGFAHTNDPSSIMNPHLPLGKMRRDIPQFDKSNFRCGYGE